MTDETTTAPTTSAPDEDTARRAAAEKNRKRTEAQWEANKKRWLSGNFPEKEAGSDGGSAS